MSELVGQNKQFDALQNVGTDNFFFFFFNKEMID